MTSIPPPPRTSFGIAAFAVAGGAATWGMANMPPSFPPWAHWLAGMMLVGVATAWGVYQDKPR